MRFYKKIRQIPSLVSIFLITNSAYAGYLENSIRNVFVNTMVIAQGMEITKIDGKPINDLIVQSKGIKVAVLPDLEYSDANTEDNYRSSGFWDKKSNVVVFSARHLNQMDGGPFGSAGRTLICHEFSGLLGINDDNFSKCAMLEVLYQFIMIDAEKRKEGAKFIHSFESVRIMANHIQMASGGTSGVGGGGDGRVNSYMMLILQNLFYRLDTNQITVEMFHKVASKIDNLNVQFNNQIKQGSFQYDIQKNKLIVPPNAMSTDENFNKNYNGVDKLVDELLK